MKKQFWALFTVGLLSASLLPATALGGAVDFDVPTGEGEKEQWIVGFHEKPEHERGDSYAGARVVNVLPQINVIVVESETTSAFEARAKHDPRVRYVEADVSDHELLFTPNDYYYNHEAHYGTHIIGMETAWDQTLGSTAVKVAMIDSGLNKGHEEFAGQSRVLQGYDFRDYDNDPEDTKGCNYHGTHTTGTAGATINNGKGFAGISQHSILPIKIFGKGYRGCGGGSASDIANAIMYAADQGAHVSSNSWGGGSYSTAINDAITYAHNAGVIHVAAAGNDGPCTDCIGNPWAPQAANVIIVSASDAADAFASFSSQGPEVDVIAPGDSIGSSTSGTADYHYMSGTSMAAPHVSGVAALIVALNPGITFADVDARIKSTATDIGETADRQGAGRLNAAGAVY